MATIRPDDDNNTNLDHSNHSQSDQSDFNRDLSRQIDRAIQQLGAASDDETRAAWRKVLDELEELIP